MAHSPKLWAIQYSNGWRYTNDPESVHDAEARGLPVVEYMPADQLRGAVDREREILRELRISGSDLDGERLAAWIERRWPDFGGQ